MKKIVIYVLIVVQISIVLIPIYWLATTSIKTFKQTATVPPHFFRFKPTLVAYKLLLGVEIEEEEVGVRTWGAFKLPRYMKNSVITAFLATLMSMVLGSFAGWGINRYKRKWTNAVAFWMLTIWMLPPIVGAVPLYVLYNKLRIYDTLWGIIMAHCGFLVPFSTWLMRSFFRDVPKELEDAARVDGCTPLQAFFRITVPISKAGLTVTAMLCFMFSWNEFLLASFLTSSVAMTAPAALPAFYTSIMINPYTGWALPAAGGVLVVIPIIVFVFPIQKYLARGFTMGVLKG